mgnify:CR=1 FL=1
MKETLPSAKWSKKDAIGRGKEESLKSAVSLRRCHCKMCFLSLQTRLAATGKHLACSEVNREKRRNLGRIEENYKALAKK